MAWGDPSDYWWLQPDPNRSSRRLQNMRFGAELAQQAIQDRRQKLSDEIQRRNVELNAQKSLIEMQQYFDGRELQNKIMAGNAKLAGALKDITDWTSPDAVKTISEVGIQHPEIVNTPQFKGALEMHQNALKAKEIRDRFNDAGYVPPDPETGAPGYFMDAKGQIRFDTRSNQPAAATWVSENKETGMPGHFKTANGRVQFPPRQLNDGTMFQPREMQTPGGTTLVQVSPNMWRVIDKEVEKGKMTDLEKRKAQDLTSRRNKLLGMIQEPSAVLGLLVGAEGEAKEQARYRKQLAEIDALSKELEALYDSIERRTEERGSRLTIPDSIQFRESGGGTPATPAPPTQGGVDQANPLGLDLRLK